jgi:hypothetical protein
MTEVPNTMGGTELGTHNRMVVGLMKPTLKELRIVNEDA